MEEIKYKVIAMRNQRPKENKEAVLKLFDDYLEWIADFDAEEPKSEDDDHTMGWETIHSYYQIVMRKNHISSIEMEFQQTPERNAEIDKDKWGVHIVKPGTVIKMWFRTYGKAEEVFNKIKEWYLKN